VAKTKRSSDEDDLDAIISKIDAGVDKIHKAVKKRTGGQQRIHAEPPAPTPTRAFSPARFKRTRKAFMAMAEESCLMDRREEEPTALPESVVVVKGGRKAAKGSAKAPKGSRRPSRAIKRAGA